MYITNTTDNVIKIIEELEQQTDLNKLKFLIYIFGLLNNNQINNKNVANSNLIEDDDLIIFNLETIGLESNVCNLFLQNNIMLYNSIINKNELYEDNGNVIGLKFDKIEKALISSFEKLSFVEKLDIFSEVIIRYDNDTYLDNKNIFALYKLNGFEVANLIREYKQSL